MQLALCRQIKTNGLRCKAPAMTEAPYCYFHSRLNERHSNFRHTAASRGYLIPGQHIQLTALEDREAVQVALSQVINALATGQLDTRRATTLLYGLQLASSNAAHLNLTPYAPEVVRTAESTPDGLDLAEPGAILDLDQLALQNADDEYDDEEDEGEEDEEVYEDD
ncbi:MAG TPA: hypothetical protein VH250_00425 [Granulicella sp.]|jgi:hypothetical protein|nr:hypothetical protein [Granulicella sp.]